MPNPESICPALSPLAETLRAHVAEYKKTLAQFEVEGTKELAEKLEYIASEIGKTERNINDALGPLGHSLDSPLPPERPDAQKIARMLREVYSIAELDPNFEGGIIHVDIDPKIVDMLKTWGAAKKAYENADTSKTFIDSNLSDYPWQPLTETSLDVLVMNHGETTSEDRDILVNIMNTIGYRPLTLAELMAFVITKPEYNKQDEVLHSYEKHKIGGLMQSQCVHRSGPLRSLEASLVGDHHWGDQNRFVFVRKSDESQS